MVLGVNAAAALVQRNLGVKQDPFKGYSFFIEIEGLLVGGFSSIDGLGSSTEVKTVREGGVNDKEYKLGGQISYSDIVLKQGITALDPMWYWYKATLEGKIKRKNGSIYLLDDQGIPNVWWNFYNAWPTKWEGPSFDASQTMVASQSFTLAHEGINKSFQAQLYAAAKGAV
jgi:phage tail-like protein